jgi:hypothetical protein
MRFQRFNLMICAPTDRWWYEETPPEREVALREQLARDLVTDDGFRHG